jgi:hypothetical protein
VGSNAPGFKVADSGEFHRRIGIPVLTLSLTGDGMVYLIDLEGKLVHTWKMPYPPGLYGYLTLPGGNILVFDNGAHRLDYSFPFSRVIEINPLTNDIVWKYQETIPSNFFSPRISNAQRLPNGNTLINEGWFGRFFEVTREGEVVWEYVSPYFGPPSEAAQALANHVFRVYRYTDEEVARARKAI